MPTPIRYDSLYLHSQYGQKFSADLRKYLNDNDIAYVDLVYNANDVNSNTTLTALSTWFRDDANTAIIFSSFPVLTYDTVYWESEDKTMKSAVRNYFVSSNNAPSDFVSLTLKNT